MNIQLFEDFRNGLTKHILHTNTRRREEAELKISIKETHHVDFVYSQMKGRTCLSLEFWGLGCLR